MAGKWTEDDGVRLRAWRKARGITRDNMALAIGIGAGTLNRWERAQVTPRAGDMELLRDLLGCNPESKQMRWPIAFDRALARWVPGDVAWPEIARRLGVSETAARRRAWGLDIWR